MYCATPMYYLCYAEALNEWKGYPTNEAYAAINKVRSVVDSVTRATTPVCDLPAALQPRKRSAKQVAR